MANEKQSVMLEHTLLELYRRNNDQLKSRPNILALLTSHMIGMEPGFTYLKKLSKDHVILRIMAEAEVLTQYSKELLVHETENDDWILSCQLSKNFMNNLDIILIPNLSFSLVSDILSFHEQRPFVRIIMEALLTGKQVIALKFGADPYHPLWKMKGMDKGTVFFKRKLNDQLYSLTSLGIKIIDEHETIDFRIQETTKKTVITEEFMRYLYKQNNTQLVITNDMIITPLARDTARELKIALIME